MEYASNGKGNLGVTLGAIGTGLGVLNGGAGLLNLGGGMTVGNTNMIDSRYATKEDLNMSIALAQKDSEIALLKSEQNTEIKIADVYERVMTRVNQDRRDQDSWNASQSVANAQMSAAIATNAASIASLQNCCDKITQIKIPNSAVCPGWGAVTITPANGTTTA
ncbi:MAG: hypothetical protein KBT06_03495 [Prevotellaceae bacterium]|nr:hypothetical protein [Candidatus Colivivens equi]